MFCSACGVKLPEEAKFCSACGVRVQPIAGPDGAASPSSVPHHSGDGNTSPSTSSVKQPVAAAGSDTPVTPTINREFRAKLLDCFLASLPSEELSRWLQDLNQDSRGKIEEKVARIRQHTRYLSTPLEEFPRETLNHLRTLNQVDVLVDICRELGLSCDGSKSALLRRIYREIGYREGWLIPLNKRSLVVDRRTVVPFVWWYHVFSWSDYERDYYDEFYDEMAEIFGADNVHDQVAVAHGSTLKIDFHIGPLQGGGVGVEFKLPANNGELQRALGQIDQYLSRYGANLIVVLIPHLLNSAEATLFRDTLRGKSVETVIKSEDTNPAVDQKAA